MLSDEQIKAALALSSHSPPVRLPQGWREFARAIEREARRQALEEASDWLRMEGQHSNADAMLCALKEQS